MKPCAWVPIFQRVIEQLDGRKAADDDADDDSGGGEGNGRDKGVFGELCAVLVMWYVCLVH